MSIATYPPQDTTLTIPLSIANGGTGATTAATARTNLGLGTMAQQDAGAVAITGGAAALNTLTVTGGVTLPQFVGDNVAALASTMVIGGGTNRYFINHLGDAKTRLGGNVGIAMDPVGFAGLTLLHLRASGAYGLLLKTDADSGNPLVIFTNVAAATVGSIDCTATATAYNTSSDVRLKHAIQALTGALDVVQALRPVAFRWNANDEPGEGFLAHELQQHIPAAVTGTPDAVDAEGNILPQGVDHSKLVPWLVAALQETLAQVQALQMEVATLKGALA